MSTPKTNTTEITVEILIQTPDAVFVSDGKREKWLAKSEITNPKADGWEKVRAGDTIAIQIPEWIAVEKGLG